MSRDGATDAHTPSQRGLDEAQRVTCSPSAATAAAAASRLSSSTLTVPIALTCVALAAPQASLEADPVSSTGLTARSRAS